MTASNVRHFTTASASHSPPVLDPRPRDYSSIHQRASCQSTIRSVQPHSPPCRLCRNRWLICEPNWRTCNAPRSAQERGYPSRQGRPGLRPDSGGRNTRRRYDGAGSTSVRQGDGLPVAPQARAATGLPNPAVRVAPRPVRVDGVAGRARRKALLAAPTAAPPTCVAAQDQFGVRDCSDRSGAQAGAAASCPVWGCTCRSRRCRRDCGRWRFCSSRQTQRLGRVNGRSRRRRPTKPLASAANR